MGEVDVQAIRARATEMKAISVEKAHELCDEVERLREWKAQERALRDEDLKYCERVTVEVERLRAVVAEVENAKHHAYLHDTQERQTLLASGPREFVERTAAEWLDKHEPDSEARVVISRVVDETDAGDFVIRALRGGQA